MTAWRDQVALVTGGARIIGRAMARLLARSAFFHRLRSSGATNLMMIGIAPSTSDALKVVIGGDRARRYRLRGVAWKKFD